MGRPSPSLAPLADHAAGLRSARVSSVSTVSSSLFFSPSESPSFKEDHVTCQGTPRFKGALGGKWSRCLIPRGTDGSPSQTSIFIFIYYNISQIVVKVP